MDHGIIKRDVGSIGVVGQTPYGLPTKLYSPFLKFFKKILHGHV